MNMWLNVLKNKGIVSLLVFLMFALFSCTEEAQSRETNEEAAVKEYKASDIIKLIKKGKPVQVANAIIFDDLDFSEVGDVYLTSGTTAAVDVVVPLYFFNCTFVNKVIAKSKIKDKVVCVTNFRRPVTFTACDFRDDVNFIRSLFIDNVDFSKSIFRGSTKFDMMTMRGEQNRFYEIESEMLFSMSATLVVGTISFMDAKFSNGLRLQSLSPKNLNLNNVVIEGETQISDMVVRGAFMANYADLGAELNLSYSTFLGTASICHSRVDNHADLSNSSFLSLVKFNDCKFHSADFTNCLFYFAPEFLGTGLGEKPKDKMVYRIIRHEEVDFAEKYNELLHLNKSKDAVNACDIYKKENIADESGKDE